jgi:hypothetical protein
MKQFVTSEEMFRCIINGLERFEMWSWRRMEISWTGRMKNVEVLPKVKEERNMLHTTKLTNADWIGHILRIGTAS